MRGTLDEMADGLAGYAELGHRPPHHARLPARGGIRDALAEAAARARERVGAPAERPAQEAAALVIRTWRYGTARAPQPGEVRADDALAAARADGPPAVALETDDMLGDEHAPAPPRTGADR